MKKSTKRTRPQTRTEKVDEAISLVMDGENADPLLKQLSEGDQELLQQALAELRQDPKIVDTYMRDLWRLDYEKRPPSMQEFLEDPYWLGAIMNKSDESEGIYPKWKELLTRDFDIDSRIHNLVVTGSLGTGKTFITVTVMLYRVVLARLLRNPQAFFGLAKGSSIFYAVLSITKSVVQETAFGDFLNFMGNCPFFTEECLFNPNKKYASMRISLGNDIVLTAGSQGWHIIGRNAMGIALDEGNFRREKNPDMKAYALYDEVRTRIRNRFQKLAGFLPAISVLSSSAKDESSFTEKVIADIEGSRKKDPEQLVYRYAVYTIKAHTLRLGPRWFRVCYGIKNIDPYLLSGWFDKERKPIGTEKHEEAPAGAQIEYVPEMYLEDFRRNTKVNLQSISGISTGGSFRFFGNVIDLERAVELGREKGLLNPCGLTSIPLSEEDDKNIWDFLDAKSFLVRKLGTITPRRDPSAIRYIHLDLATRTQAGLSVCHVSGSQMVEGIFKAGGDIFAERRMVVEYDFILSIIAGKVKPISLNKIMSFLFWLKQIANFRIGVITGDQFQSAMMLQTLNQQGFKTANLSVDRSRVPYDAWRSGFEESRIRMYQHDILMHEATNLVDLGEKIDHQAEGSKDVTDSACGAYYSALTFKDERATARSAHGADPGIYTNVDIAPDTKDNLNVVDTSKFKREKATFDL